MTTDDVGLEIAVATILDRLSRREPWEILVHVRNVETGERNGRTVTVSDVREALHNGVDVKARVRLVSDFGTPQARARAGGR